MTQQQHAQPATTAAPHRRTSVRYAAIAGAVLLVAGGIVLLVTLLSGPAPVDYKVTATGAGNATWITPDGTGQIDLTSGTATQTVHAGQLDVTVTSTAADGASCRITALDGTVVDEQQSRGGSEFVTVTCSTTK